MLSIEILRKQCSIDDDIDEHDELLTLYLHAAKRAVANELNRKVYWHEDEKPKDLSQVPEDAITATADFELAVMLLVTHWFKNREATSEGDVKQVPLAFRYLLSFDKDINL